MATASDLRPFFLAGASGPLFALFHPPKEPAVRDECFVFVPPFGEEANRSRRVVALQAQALAAAGIGVLLLDLFGCGDSAGELADATWDRWLADVDVAAGWIEREQGVKVGLWGLRLGASLAVAVAERYPRRFSRLLLWEPVVSGQAFLTQVLRSRVASAMNKDMGQRETTDSLRQRLSKGESLEVSGYIVAPELAAGIDAVDLAACGLRGLPAIHWMEVAGEVGHPLSAPARRVIECWRQADIAVCDNVSVSPRFWTLIETTVAPGLVAATCRELGLALS